MIDDWKDMSYLKLPYVRWFELAGILQTESAYSSPDQVCKKRYSWQKDGENIFPSEAERIREVESN